MKKGSFHMIFNWPNDSLDKFGEVYRELKVQQIMTA